VSGYDVIYPKVKEFVRDGLFDRQVGLDDLNTLRNLSEPAVTRALIETFKKEINALTVQDKGDARIQEAIKLRKTRPFVVKEQGYLVPKKSIFNKIVGDSPLELQFASFLDRCGDNGEIVSFAKNFFAVGFKLDYVKADGSISTYTPDFIVKKSATEIFIIETKGQEDLDVPPKMARLRQWCEDVNKAQDTVKYSFVYVDQEGFEKYKPKRFADLVEGFNEYREASFRPYAIHGAEPFTIAESAIRWADEKKAAGWTRETFVNELIKFLDSDGISYNDH
jgi:type III restriction enzyme